MDKNSSSTLRTAWPCIQKQYEWVIDNIASELACKPAAFGRLSEPTARIGCHRRLKLNLKFPRYAPLLISTCFKFIRLWVPEKIADPYPRPFAALALVRHFARFSIIRTLSYPQLRPPNSLGRLSAPTARLRPLEAKTHGLRPTALKKSLCNLGRSPLSKYICLYYLYLTQNASTSENQCYRWIDPHTNTDI